MKILFASQNKGKLAEVKLIVDQFGFELLTPVDIPTVSNLDVDETGNTFSQNALLKAKEFSDATGLVVIADDSGLEVEAMNGGPGVKSARWVSGSDQDRNTALLEKLKGEKNRSARFVTVLCFYDPAKGDPKYFEGEVKGNISDSPQGSEGFGYDPVFIPEGYSKTFAQIGVVEKNKLSHRKKALEKLGEFLKIQYKS